MRNIKIGIDKSGASIELLSKSSSCDSNLSFKIIAISVTIGFLNGFFGGGGGMICVPLLKHFYKLEDKVAHATTLFVMLPLSIISAIVYWNKMGDFSFKYLYMISGVIVGGVIGAMLLKKLSNKAINIIFGIIIVLGGIRMLF